MPEIPPIESMTVGAIYKTYEAKQHDVERPYLGLSTFGTECDRALWYGWRWAAKPEQFDGRKLRLFETGHREEDRLIADLVQAGVAVDAVDPATGKQWDVWAVSGHVRGHLDGRAMGVPEAPKTRHVVECKTHNEKSFMALIKDGVQRAKPGHFAQMQGYMHLIGDTRALYLAANKNDEGLYVERVSYDATFAVQLMARAERIVLSERPPSKLHDNPMAKMAFVCGYCPAFAICHDGHFARQNCRTCLHSTAVIGESNTGLWRCEKHSRDLTVDEQRTGCSSHLFIPDLVPGEQVDFDDVAEQVTYRLPGGETWIDGPKTADASGTPTREAA